VAAAVGVPLMLPLLVLNVRPAGSAGETLQLTTAPPPVVAVMVLLVGTFAVYA